MAPLEQTRAVMKRWANELPALASDGALIPCGFAIPSLTNTWLYRDLDTTGMADDESG